MSTEFYPATGLIGGAAGDLDKIPSATLGDADVALVTIAAKFYVYRFDSSSAAAESSPDIITPDDIGGNGRWLLVGILDNSATVAKSDFDATTFLYATANDTPEPKTPAEVMAILSGTATAAFDFNGQYATQLQNIPDLAAKGAGYWFNGVDDQLSIALDATRTPAGNKITIVGLTTSHDLSAIQYIGYVRGDPATTNYCNYSINTSGLLVAGGKINNVAFTVTATSGAITAGQQMSFCHVVDNTSQKLYVNGSLVADETEADWSGFVGDGGIYLGRSLSPVNGNCSWAILYQFNLALTATEVKAFSSGAPVPYKYIGASQTAEAAGDDSDFDTVGNWTGVGATLTGGYDSGDAGHDKCLRIEADADGTWIRARLASASLTSGSLIPGKQYRLTFDYKWITAPGSYANTVWWGSTSTGVSPLTGSLIWTEYSCEATYTGTAASAEGLRIYVTAASGGHADNELLVDNVTLTQIGCVLQLEQDSITDATWFDKSGNDLDGTVSGAVAINLPDAGSDFAMVKAALAIADSAVDFNAQALTGVASVTLPNAGWIGIGAAAERLEFYTAGYAAIMGANFGVGTATPADKLHIIPISYANNQDGGIRLSDIGDHWIGRLAIKSNAGGTPRLAIDFLGTEAISVVGAGDVDIVSHNAATVGLKLGGTLVTASAAELNQLDDNTLTNHLTLHITDTDGDTEGDIWYDASEDKLKFKTAAGVETITSA